MFIFRDENQHMHHALIEKIRSTGKGKLGFPPAFHIILYHLRLLLYKCPSFYQEIEDFITTENDLQNKKSNLSKKKAV
jgi:hypothetical protein